MLGLSVLVVGVWVGNDDRTPMKGVTGGSLPAEIWKQFVDAAMPNLDASSRLELARGTSDPSSAPVSDQAECDQAACAAAYRSFRALIAPISRTAVHVNFASSTLIENCR